MIPTPLAVYGHPRQFLTRREVIGSGSLRSVFGLFRYGRSPELKQVNEQFIQSHVWVRESKSLEVSHQN